MATPDQPSVVLHGTATPALLAGPDTAGESYTQRGTTEHFVVNVSDALGAPGLNLGDAVLATCEADYQQLSGWFGDIAIANLPFSVFIRPGVAGATHQTCTNTGLFCDAFFGTDLELTRWLVVAEASEVFMASQASGLNCRDSNGEALSRILATESHPLGLTPAGAGVDFATAARWLASPRLSYVDNPLTDQDFIAIGCGTLFINWLRFQLHYSLDQIVQAGGPNLAAVYSELTKQPNGFDEFKQLIDAHFPPDPPPVNDNAFPL